MAKRRYRSVPVKQLDVLRLCEELAGHRVIVAIDIAKEDMFAAVMDEKQHVRKRPGSPTYRGTGVTAILRG
jgi:hypothetical protein